MIIEKFRTSDGVDLSYRAEEPEKARAAAVFLSGIESHGGWYAESLQYLAACGISSYFLDRRGSGESGGRRGDAPSRKRLLLDLEEFTGHVKANSNAPLLVLAAISWGAKWALDYWFETGSNPYHKLILITPGICRKVDLPVHEKLRAAAANIGSPEKYFWVPIPTEFFTGDPGKIEYLVRDPHRLKQVTARFLRVTCELDRSLGKERGVFPQPVRLFQAGRERIVDNQRNRKFLKERFFDFKEYFYPNACHTLEFEKNSTYRQDLASAI